VKQNALVYGLAVAGAATARALLARGYDVLAADDSDTPARRQLAADLGVELVIGPGAEELAALISRSDVIVPAPGIPEEHPVIAGAHGRGVRIAGEIELAYDWEQERAGGPRPLLAITGTDGKTTTTLLTVAMLEAAGLRAVAAGNTDVPLVTAVDLDVDVLVVECTSFRLAWTEHFRGTAAAWLNLAPDHLNWHRSMATYAAAKGRIFDNQRPNDVAIGHADDAEVMRRLAVAPGRHVTFALAGADYQVAGDVLISPHGEITEVAAMRRSLPHDITNGLAAAALVLETALADGTAVHAALASFAGPPHRIELVAEAEGVAWFNDSKATTPHAAAAAIGGFDHVVLIAGGRNKGLDLAPMAAAPGRVRTVVAVGEASDDVAAAFTAVGVAVQRASTMPEAVDVAGAAALPGDVVLLSPGCASFDWYPEGGFEARGDHFRHLVREYVRSLRSPASPHTRAAAGRSPVGASSLASENGSRDDDA
jgi:UDP-N-acetylmuramoylalanine--D-glutamate ligase